MWGMAVNSDGCIEWERMRREVLAVTLLAFVAWVNLDVARAYAQLEGAPGSI